MHSISPIIKELATKKGFIRSVINLYDIIDYIREKGFHIQINFSSHLWGFKIYDLKWANDNLYYKSVNWYKNYYNCLEQSILVGLSFLEDR